MSRISNNIITKQTEDADHDEIMSSAIISRLLDKIDVLESSNQKLEEFAFVASHDLKEPLRKIQLHESMIRHLLPKFGNEEIKLHLDKIISASERMQQLIEDILSFAGIKNTFDNFQQVDLNLVLKNVYNDLEESILKNNAAVHWDELPLIKGDYSQLGQVFQNLISNAIKFRFELSDPIIQIKNKGIVSLEESLLKHKNVHGIDSVNYYHIDISDNGIGFEMEEREKIFQLFSRLHSKDAFAGSGIGLAIVKQIMDHHKGIILANSEPGKGTTFSLFFPKA